MGYFGTCIHYVISTQNKYNYLLKLLIFLHGKKLQNPTLHFSTLILSVVTLLSLVENPEFLFLLRGNPPQMWCLCEDQ